MINPFVSTLYVVLFQSSVRDISPHAKSFQVSLKYLPSSFFQYPDRLKCLEYERFKYFYILQKNNSPSACWAGSPVCLHSCSKVWPRGSSVFRCYSALCALKWGDGSTCLLILLSKNGWRLCTKSSKVPVHRSKTSTQWAQFPSIWGWYSKLSAYPCQTQCTCEFRVS